jgi:hypothetical protein
MRANEARIISLSNTAAELAAKTGKTTADVLAAMLAIERHQARSQRAWERANSYDHGEKETARLDAIEEREGKRVEEIAATLGLKTSWPGLYPSFTDAAGHSVSWNWGN